MPTAVDMSCYPEDTPSAPGQLAGPGPAARRPDPAAGGPHRTATRTAASTSG